MKSHPMLKDENGKIIEKQCSKCKIMFPIDSFTKDCSRFTKTISMCKTCEIFLKREKGIKAKKPETFNTDLGIERICTKCNLQKLLSEFDKQPNGYMGHEPRCRECKRRHGELYRRDKGIRPKRTIPIIVDEHGMVTHRECARCLKMLPLDVYRKGKNKPYGVHPHCKECDRECYTILKYGINNEQKQTMYINQNKQCASCKYYFDFSILVVDHCHKTGDVRGLICDKCNLALGLMGDGANEETVIKLSNMVEYIKSHIANKHTR